jgi:hypothetical protein
MNNLPRTQEEQIMRMVESGKFNHNWLERVAYPIGMDFDRKQDGSDEEFSKEEFNNNKQ